MRALNLRTLISIAAFLVVSAEVRGGDSPRNAMQVWIPDNRDGSYTNPIIFADYSDPDVIRVGDDFDNGQTFQPIGLRFKAREGRWMGAKVGLFCSRDGQQSAGHADFDWFRFES